MRKIQVCFILFVLMFAYAHNVFAQELAQTLRGTITDKDSKIPLEGANVLLVGTASPMGSTRDSEGRFRIENVPLGRHSIKVSFIGFEDKLYP